MKNHSKEQLSTRYCQNRKVFRVTVKWRQRKIKDDKKRYPRCTSPPSRWNWRQLWSTYPLFSQSTPEASAPAQGMPGWWARTGSVWRASCVFNQLTCVINWTHMEICKFTTHENSLWTVPDHDLHPQSLPILPALTPQSGPLRALTEIRSTRCPPHLPAPAPGRCQASPAPARGQSRPAFLARNGSVANREGRCCEVPAALATRRRRPPLPWARGRRWPWHGCRGRNAARNKNAKSPQIYCSVDFYCFYQLSETLQKIILFYQ